MTREPVVFDKATVVVPSSIHARFGHEKIGSALQAYVREERLKSRANVRELAKDAWELAAIAEVSAAYDRFRASFGLAPYALFPEDVHVLSAEEYATVFPHWYGAVTRFRQCYMVRRKARALFFGELTHELFHMGAYVHARVDVSHREDQPSFWWDEKQVGIVFHARFSTHVRKAFLGLNEAVTEIASRMLCRDLLSSPLLDESGRLQIANGVGHGYVPHVRIAETIFRCPPADDPDYPGERMRQLLLDAQTGSIDGLRRLAREDRRALKALARMGDDVFSARDVVETLRLPITVELPDVLRGPW